MCDRRVLGVTLFVVACAGSAPPARPAPAFSGTRQQGEVAFPPTEEELAYGRMAIAAMDQVKLMIVGRVAGMYQDDDPAGAMHHVVKVVLDGSGFREIHQGETKLACGMASSRTGLRGIGSPRTQACGLDIVDVLLQIVSVQIKDTHGYVGGYLTEVARGEDRPRATPFCVEVTSRDGAWVDGRSLLVKLPKECTADRKH